MVTNLSGLSSAWNSVENDKGTTATFYIDGVTNEVSRLFVENEIKSQQEIINQSQPSATTIFFRVGGITFEVSRSLVEAFPNTILFRLLSKANNAIEPIFVECNGNRFEYVLEYMRYRKVFLPDYMLKEALLHDLKYLGFENVIQSDIKSLGEKTRHSPYSLSTVSFRVGGVMYEVSRSLVESFPNTMLFKLLSERRNSIHDGSEAIFIDRNGSRFEYVLDYMRDGQVLLPECIPKELFLREMKYLGFENINQHDIKSHTETFNEVPCLVSNLTVFQHEEFHQIKWDVKRTGTCLVIENKNLSVKQSKSNNCWQSTFGIEGYSSGIHYWNIIISNSIHNQILIGISKNGKVAPGCGTDKGASYYGFNGHRRFAGRSTSFGPTYTTGDVIGTLLNMNQKTVTFDKNGVNVGTAIENCHLTDDIYYPCVSLFSLGDQIMSSEISLIH